MQVKIPDSGYLVAPHGGEYVQAFRTGRGALADLDVLAKARHAAEALANKERIAVDIIRVSARGEDRYIVEEVYPRAWGQEPYRTETRHHATKKSPAQLQREINEALRRRAMALDPAQVGREITEGFARQHAFEEARTPAQRAYVAAVEEDVRLFPSAYKAAVRANPTAWALNHIAGLDDADIQRMAREQRAETKLTLRASGQSGR